MRISSSMIHTQAANAIQNAEAALAKTQSQITSQSKVQKPSDDPVAAVRILQLQQQQNANDQYATNISAATNRLNLDGQAMTDTTTLLQRVRDLVVQGANFGSMTPSDRKALATEMASRLSELQDIANRKESNGEYLYGGFAGQTQPFALNGSGAIQYQGDQGNRTLQVSDSQYVVDGHSGYEAFVNVPQGNGTFYTTAASANTGSGSINVGTVTNKAAWIPDNYTLSFTSATTYQVTDSATPANVVTSGNYTAGSAITFNGVQVAVSGAPASGDSFAINKSGSEDIFSTLNKIVTALNTPAASDAAIAQISTVLGNSLQQLDQALDHVSFVNAQVGARLNTLDTTESARAENSDNLAKSMSDVRDLDYAAAFTKYSQQQLTLQAAQQSYVKISQLSLFNFL